MIEGPFDGGRFGAIAPIWATGGWLIGHGIAGIVQHTRAPPVTVSVTANAVSLVAHLEI